MESNKKYHIMEKITLDDKILTDCKLPTIRKVVRCFKCQRDIIGLSYEDSMKEVISQIKLCYNKVNIPVLGDYSLMLHIKKELNEITKFRKNLKRENLYGRFKMKREDIRLNLTFRGYPQDVLNKIKNEEDRLFFKSVMKDRLAIMASLGQVMANQGSQNKNAKKYAVTNRAAMIHYKMVYTMEEKPFSCDVCEENFKTKGDLSNRRRTHTSEKPLEYKTGEDKFSEDRNLSNDEKEPFYLCNICNSKYSSYREFASHKRVHKNSCVTCQRRFKRKDRLTLHYKTAYHLN